MSADFYAHSLEGRPETDWELLEAHLNLTAEGDSRFAGAAGFAAAFGAPEWGRLVGLWHDLGKYSREFQEYLQKAGRDEAIRRGEVDHSTAGAQRAFHTFGEVGRVLAYCLAGHHGGLPDDTGDASLENRLRKKSVPPVVGAPPELLDRAMPSVPAFEFSAERSERAFQIATFCRFLFSCLVDADFLATELFLNPEQAEERSRNRPSIHRMREALGEHLRQLMAKAADTPVNRQRRSVLDACRQAAEMAPGLFSLTVPTGGGKSLSSLAFGLDHATIHGLRRLIYAIPFTSIIEQNAAIFREALESAGADCVLEHHSNFDLNDDLPQNRLASENWDAPLVVTTNVQFFESLFASRTSRCRKLHRIARSVIILDEVQTLPVDLLRASLAILQELCRNYGCSIVLCSATQPAVERREDFPIGLRGVREIVREPKVLFTALKRVQTSFLGALDDETLAERLDEQTSVLCIVNTRGHAAALFERLAAHGDGCAFHLSAQMCPEHRSRKLAKIREALKDGRPCRVVSTQLVEAGVDLDFPVVYRALAGIDSIAQAAGRCNREGRREWGQVYVFRPQTEAGLHVKQAAQCTTELLPEYGHDLLGLDAVEAYFRLHYWKRADEWDKHRIMGLFQLEKYHFQFREAAGKYRIIRDVQVPVIVPYDKKAERLIRQLTTSSEPPGYVFHRQIQRYTVTVHERGLQTLRENQVVGQYFDNFWVLENSEAYDKNLGVRFDKSGYDPSQLMY